MKRPGGRPTLDGMMLPSGGGGATPLTSSTDPQYHPANGGAAPLGRSVTSSATGRPVPVVGPGGRVHPRLSESWARDGGPTSMNHRGGAPPQALASVASVNQSALSFLVSASGGMLTLGDHYHVSSSGVADLKDGTRTRDLGLAARPAGELSCTHVSELDFDNGFQIGRGSSGKVYNVLHTPSGKRVCVKQMTIDDAHHREEIRRELDTFHAAPSPWIVDFHGAFFHNDLGVILLVLELMDGSLKDLLTILGRLTEQQVRAVSIQAVHGLITLHQDRRLIHRDIKPENLLFNHAGRLKVTDFGVSRGHRSHEPGSAVTFVGSISYMSPERLEGKAYGHEVDVWSLGILLCEAVTGYHPYQDQFGPDKPKMTFWDLLQKVVNSGEDGGAVSPLLSCLDRMDKAGVPRPPVSASMIDFVAKCLAYDRAQRATAESLLSHPWLAGMSIAESETLLQSLALQAAQAKAEDSHRHTLAAGNASSTGTDPSPRCIGDDPQQVGAAIDQAPPSTRPEGTAALGMRHPAPGAAPSAGDSSRQRGDALLDDLLMSTRPKPRR